MADRDAEQPGVEREAEQAERVDAFKRGETRKLIGIGLTHFTEIVGAETAAAVRDLTLDIYSRAEAIARERGISTAAASRTNQRTAIQAVPGMQSRCRMLSRGRRLRHRHRR